MAAPDPGLRLSSLVFGRTDLVRLRRELESLADYLHQAALRKQDKAEIKLPKTSRLLDEFSRDNGLDLLHRSEHDRALGGIESLLKTAPELHFSFSTEPSSAFLAKLVVWLRTNVHPAVLITVGLQPDIAAGCIVRSRNKQFDLSLRSSFASKHGLLAEQLHGEAGGE